MATGESSRSMTHRSVTTVISYLSLEKNQKKRQLKDRGNQGFTKCTCNNDKLMSINAMTIVIKYCNKIHLNNES